MQHNRPFTPTDQLWRDFQALGTVTAVAALRGLSICNVSARLKRAGYTVKPLIPTDKLWQDYVRLGSSIKVGRLHGMTHSNVVQRLHKAGYTLRRPGPKPYAGRFS